MKSRQYINFWSKKSITNLPKNCLIRYGFYTRRLSTFTIPRTNRMLINNTHKVLTTLSNFTQIQPVYVVSTNQLFNWIYLNVKNSLISQYTHLTLTYVTLAHTLLNANKNYNDSSKPSFVRNRINSINVLLINTQHV